MAEGMRLTLPPVPPQQVTASIVNTPIPPLEVGSYFNQCPGMLKEAISTYFPVSQWENAARISYCESGWREDAHHESDVENSKGVFQINALAHPDLDSSLNLFTYWDNTRAASTVWSRSGNRWRPWYCCARKWDLTPYEPALSSG